ALTFRRLRVCSRNLWEVSAATCVTLLPNSLSSSYPGMPPGMAKAIQIQAVCVGPLEALFYFPNEINRRTAGNSGIRQPSQGISHERQEPRSEPDDRRRHDRARADRSWHPTYLRLPRRRGASAL